MSNFWNRYFQNFTRMYTYFFHNCNKSPVTSQDQIFIQCGWDLIKVRTKSGHGDIKRLDFCNFQVYITLSWTLVFCSYEWVTALKPPIPHLFLCVSPLEFFDRVKGFLASSFTCRNDLVSHPVAEGAWVILEISQSGPTMLTKFKVIPCYYFIQILKKNIIN